MEIDSCRPLEGRFLGYILDLDGLMHYSGRIYLPLLDYICTLILSKAHYVPYSIHLGVKKMHVDM